MKALTDQQQRVLDVFRQRAKQRLPPPTYRELCRQLSWASTATARDHIRALVRKGVLCGANGRARGAYIPLSQLQKLPTNRHRVTEAKPSSEAVNTTPAWREKIIEAAKRWPTRFEARRVQGIWRLEGAGNRVRQEFKELARYIARQLALPLGSTDPIDALLYRLMQYRRYVRASEEDHSDWIGPLHHVSKRSVVSIKPLAEALIEFVNDCEQHVKEKQPKIGVQSGGQVAAAQQNRQREARMRIQQELVRLRIPTVKWPGFAQEPVYSELRHSIVPPPFKPPEFERLRESVHDWEVRADESWNAYKQRFKDSEDFYVEKGINEALPKKKGMRGRGTKGVRGKNSIIHLRYEWAAKRLCGYSWKQISDSTGPDTVRKAATEVLRVAGWPRRQG
jgi:hypothetical protein